MYALHHQEQYHEDAFAFKPERWLEVDVARVQEAFFPFGIGPRACAGKGIAYAEMMVLIARMVWLFDMRLSEKETVYRYGVDKRPRRKEMEFQVFDSVIAITDGPMVEFRAREG